MTDFRQKLADIRAKEALEKRLNKAKRESAPSMVPGFKKKRGEEPPPPDISELDLDKNDRELLAQTVKSIGDINKTLRTLKKDKKEQSNIGKEMCKEKGLARFMVDGARVAYYQNNRPNISKELLLAAGVSPETIAKCTNVSKSWTLKVTLPGQKEEEEDEE